MTSKFLIIAIEYYQLWISRWFRPSCRFYPSCSEYAKLSFKAFGFWKALTKSATRICKCHPMHPGGVDWP